MHVLRPRPRHGRVTHSRVRAGSLCLNKSPHDLGSPGLRKRTCPVYFRPCGEGSELVPTSVYTQHSCNVCLDGWGLG